MPKVQSFQDVASPLRTLLQRASQPEIAEPLKQWRDAAETIGEASSGSWIGLHSRVYYRDFRPPPAGANFSSEWGFNAVFSPSTTGDWLEYSKEDIERALTTAAEGMDLESVEAHAEEIRTEAENATARFLSLMSSVDPDPLVLRLRDKLDELRFPRQDEVIRDWTPTSFLTRDSLAASQGIQPPPHLRALARVAAVELTIAAAEDLVRMIDRGEEHLVGPGLDRLAPPKGLGRVFIGHGRSSLWREFKDFISERLGLPWEEFNRVPIAGVSNSARLSEMLDTSGIAFLILTAEDDQADGTSRARQNVVHEAGLFQGRLGFTKAIILVEEGCEPFSNVDGLGQIRFPPGQIHAVFENVRLVLEREGFIGSDESE